MAIIDKLSATMVCIKQTYTILYGNDINNSLLNAKYVIKSINLFYILAQKWIR